MSPFALLRAHGLGFPEAEEDFPWGHTALKVRGKTFAWLDESDGSFSLTVKLPASRDFALVFDFAEPAGYGLGRSGWISCRFAAGEAADGDEAVAQAASLQPDLILMDLHMPGCGGLGATEEILRMSPHVGVLMLTMVEDDESLFAAMRVGARGYVLKDMDDDEMIRAIRAVGNGEAIFSPAVAVRLMSFFGTAPRRRRPLPT